MENDGAERLAQWIKRSRLNQMEAAELIGIDQTQLSQILNGKRRPGLDNAVKIERATGLAVEAWVPTVVDVEPDQTSAIAETANIGKV